ncbi:exodeoxyribonuclease VII small subunit [uncultured Sutterella sp.]|uniref:exodeoxyribonuclease VII small subunit n=1 Tax=uncultured Sutterella sp. TaxID=286133 RepID=UPI0025D50870|nr:exodeoxyribonuclease VII small subunit [uncultured Sutterella sp.]
MTEEALKPVEQLTFEEALAELEDLTARMASGTVTLDESVKGYERGAQLLKRCRGELERAKISIERIRQENDVEDSPF